MRIQGRTVVVVSSMLLVALASKPAIGDDGAGPQLETAPAAPVAATPISGGIWSTKRKIAVWTAAGGVVALTLGAAFGLSAMKQQRDAHSRCPDPRLGCYAADSANALIDSAHVSAGRGGDQLERDDALADGGRLVPPRRPQLKRKSHTQPVWGLPTSM